MGPDIVERFDNIWHVLDILSDTVFRLKIEGLEPVRPYSSESEEGEAGNSLVVFDETLVLHPSDPDANRLLVKPNVSADARWTDVPVAESVEFRTLERHLAEYSNLIGPNTTMAQNTIPGTPIAAGDVLRLTGSGAFDLSKDAASGGGSFTHYKPDGSVFARGVWVVTGFQSFTSYGGSSSGIQGGVLLVTVSLIGPEATFTGLTLQVSCHVNAPANAPEEGTTLPGLFSVPTGGNTLFHFN